MGKREKFLIEYESCGKWYFWKYAPSRKRAKELIASRTNPVALCRIKISRDSVSSGKVTADE